LAARDVAGLVEAGECAGDGTHGQLLDVLRDGRESDVGEAGDAAVVEAGDGHVVGHGQAGTA
jgi:hypothetical protein